ncbi:hypothetical protein [Candidatus Uabimicrobium amorphum]|uniref:Lipoprotein n=1 Tax=Uabimicrobium amorphum TaxID=2596890 RepID=A0A5S9IIG9_UABAM|nr:hypothetical protein [Candidatus Uabimicrobium amorphum]BBM82274.1 hypothetical protein UABAM_00617 [Candidatus Uabimicrobium amorphum]
MLKIWFILALLFTGCSYKLIESKQIDVVHPQSTTGIPYYLPKSMFLVDLQIGDKVVETVKTDKDNKVISKQQILQYEAKIKLTQKAVPDPDQVYLLNYDSSIWYNDSIDVRISKDGFIQTFVSDILPEEDFTAKVEGESKDESSIELPNSSITLNFTITDAPQKFSSEEARLVSELRDDLKVLKGNQNFSFDVRDKEQQVRINNPVATGNLKMTLSAKKFSVKNKKNTTTQPPTTTEEFDNGIKFRLPYPYVVNLSLYYENREGKSVKLANMNTIALLPDDSPVYTLPAERYAMVHSALVAEFRNGQLQNSKIKKPSPVYSILNLPKTILGEVKELLEAIGQAIDSKIGAILGVGGAAAGGA